jgi:hypothetical protein
MNWPPSNVVTGSNPGQVNLLLFSFSRHGVGLRCTNNYRTKCMYFSKIYYGTLLYNATVSYSDPISEVSSPLMQYYRWHEIKKCDFRLGHSAMKSI